MVVINGTTISMIRGDTAKIHVEITNPDGTEYVVQEHDVIRFAVKKKFTDDEVLIHRLVDNETGLLVIEPEDTEDLEMGNGCGTKGQYVYDIQITQVDGTVDTFIRGVLKLLEEAE